VASKNVHTVTDASFQSDVLESDVPVLLDFTATWCVPCKAIAPILDEIADSKLGALKVCKIDIDQNTDTPNKFAVMSIPTLMVFKGGKMIDKRVGSGNKAQIEAFLGKAI
jgi:thioredoxin 1